MFVKTLQDLSVPEEKDVIFVSPEPPKWFSLLAENKSSSGNLSNKLESRKELFRIARNYTRRIINIACRDNGPENIIATGHQAVWHHCGVWAKDLTASKFAQAVGGSSLHLVLDHDICDTAMVLPEETVGGGWHFKKIEIEPKQVAVPLEFRRSLQKDHAMTFAKSVISARAEQFCADMWLKCAALKNNIARFNNIADVITCFQSILSAALGLDLMYLPVSKLSQSDAFVRFVTAILSSATSFATCYNDAIANQINEWKINPRETIQRLVLDKTTGLTELPFWVFSPDGKRTSLYVRSNEPDKIVIGTASTVLGHLDSACWSGKTDQLKNILRRLGYSLRPKAVSLTLFVRLFLADWFVHGVGGVHYEYIVDHMIEDYYGIRGLSFGVAAATVTLPLRGFANNPEETITELRQQLRRLEYNPEKFIEAPLREREPVKSLIARKKKFVRTALGRNLAAQVKKSAWNSIGEVNKKLLEYAESSLRELDERIRLSENHELSRQIHNHREYFFGLFPEEKLRKMVELSIFGGL